MIGEAVPVRGQGKWQLSVPFPQFCSKPKTALRNTLEEKKNLGPHVSMGD